jgi:curli biogenesis system outer membrane secretion channel CsgG
MYGTVLTLISLLFIASGCATVTKEVVNEPEKQVQISKTISSQTATGLKRKVAIARFSNETKHGNSFLLDSNNDRVGKQAMDILSSRLTSTGKFLLFERADLGKIKAEQVISDLKSKIIGADYLIVGSVSEFGRSTTSEVGVFSRNKKQRAFATVNIRLIDVKTGQVVFSQEGSGEALSEAGRIFGVGDTAGYNSSLDDKALSAAISKMVSNIIENLLDKPWLAYIVDNTNGQIIVTGGKSQGVKIGAKFNVMQQGRKVKNRQTGMLIQLPGTKVAELEVVGLAGEGNDEVSINVISSGSIDNIDTSILIVKEK